MIEKERHVLIMDQLRDNGFVSVKDLMAQLDTSRSSIMRDLIALEKQGLLKREHGGAALPAITQTLSRKSEPAVAEKINENVREKRMAAAAAAKRIRPGSCIFVDSGTTTPYLLEAIQDPDLTVVTASVYLLSHLPKNFPAKVYLLGGLYDAKYEMNQGEYAGEMLEMFHIDAGFFSASGVDLKSGDVMVADFSLAASKKRAMKRCARRYLVIDETKIGQIAESRYAGISDFDEIFVSGKKRKNYPDSFVSVEERKK